jgi:hypothetical protein
MGELFILHKNRRAAKALMLTYQLGWEVRLMVGTQLEVVQTKVCRTQEDVLTTGAEWKAALGERVALRLKRPLRSLDGACRAFRANEDREPVSFARGIVGACSFERRTDGLHRRVQARLCR